MNTRQDAWQDQDDLILAETVLLHIREGGTQLESFEQAGEKLSRTSAACGFRWNSFVRKRYESEIREAKKQRSENKNKTSRPRSDEIANIATVAGERDVKAETDYADIIISATKNLKAQTVNMAKQIKALTKELEDANKRISSLESQLLHMNPETLVSEDYQTLITILERARKLGALSRMSV